MRAIKVTCQTVDVRLASNVPISTKLEKPFTVYVKEEVYSELLKLINRNVLFNEDIEKGNKK